ncbi:YciI family protein [Actinopolyspora sp. H202]|uniref:YciI family protein n=1 Tax=Actinopolyspora sp. H202 TaxID=1500456 RepID=UPI003EE4E3CD
MATFVVHIRYGEDRELLERVRPEHRDYAKDLANRGVLLAGGPFVDGDGAMLVYEVPDRAELDRILAEDPYAREGVLGETTVREWKAVTGSWLG